MDHNTIVAAALGVLEGLTEFIPVSSTGHLLLAGHFLGFDSPARSFEVLIQLGALLAILGLYAARLVQVVRDAPHDPVARRFIGAVLLAFAPAAVIGAKVAKDAATAGPKAGTALGSQGETAAGAAGQSGSTPPPSQAPQSSSPTPKPSSTPAPAAPSTGPSQPEPRRPKTPPPPAPKPTGKE